MEEERKRIEEVLAGDKHAFTYIINKYKNQLYATILRMTKQPQDAQDLVQECFIKVYRQLSKYDHQGSFKSWIYRVAINHCMDEFRKKRYKIKHVEFQDSVSEPRTNPEMIFLKKEKERQLERLLLNLPEDERMIILLRYIQELSYEEISTLVDLPLSTVRNKLHRAKKKMRNEAKQKGGYFDEVSNDR
ncbi:RNA polymerase sigma factor [Bacillus solitudinis]|uniref:RNA polymerase sigma factor n=1 Tax=Bacillus solitudinis TaxID=2014074 RepID=UPI000C24ED20|nr:sigma-70 family RNA polymerase sigma factor [Bacillus solitudinis]